MDIRPLLYLWVNKPDTFDDGSMTVEQAMKISTYQQGQAQEEMYGYCAGKMFPKWGDPYGLLELWLDLDSFIVNLDSCHLLLLYNYYIECKEEDNWEKWPEPCGSLKTAFEHFVRAML